MNQSLIHAVEAGYRKSKVPDFTIGDTVAVAVRIREGEKERTQQFNGVVIGRRGGGTGETFTVRHIDPNGEGVERVFPLHSPNVGKIQVVRSGKVRRAKLYFLRDRIGKARRLRERRTAKKVEDKNVDGKKASKRAAKAAAKLEAESQTEE
jgi:large subunit ribosomal protein L19